MTSTYDKIGNNDLYFLCICHKDRLRCCYYFGFEHACGSSIFSSEFCRNESPNLFDTPKTWWPKRSAPVCSPSSTREGTLIFKAYFRTIWRDKCSQYDSNSRTLVWEAREDPKTPRKSRTRTTEFLKGRWFCRKQYILALLLFRLCVRYFKIRTFQICLLCRPSNPNQKSFNFFSVFNQFCVYIREKWHSQKNVHKVLGAFLLLLTYQLRRSVPKQKKRFIVIFQIKKNKRSSYLLQLNLNYLWVIHILRQLQGNIYS